MDKRYGIKKEQIGNAGDKDLTLLELEVELTKMAVNTNINWLQAKKSFRRSFRDVSAKDEERLKELYKVSQNTKVVPTPGGEVFQNVAKFIHQELNNTPEPKTFDNLMEEYDKGNITKQKSALDDETKTRLKNLYEKILAKMQ